MKDGYTLLGKFLQSCTFHCGCMAFVKIYGQQKMFHKFRPNVINSFLTNKR